MSLFHLNFLTIIIFNYLYIIQLGRSVILSPMHLRIHPPEIIGYPNLIRIKAEYSF
jgi:hypothetical protein